MEIIVLSITPYKEKDGIVESLSKDGLITFLAKGIFDPKNKNAAINNIMVKADIELSEGKQKYPVLKTASILDTPLKSNSNLCYLSGLMYIAEITKALLQEDEKVEMYGFLSKSLNGLKKDEKGLFVILAYTAKVLKTSGYEFDVNHCVFCGKKENIVTFSFNEGGFVCGNCFKEDMERDLNKSQMLLLRAAFNTNDPENVDFPYEKEDALVVLNKFYEFIIDSFGVRLKSFTLIK